MKHLGLSEAVQRALEAFQAAERAFVAGRDPMSPLELLKIRLADAVLAQLAADRLDRLPRRADHGIVYVKLQRTRRRQG